jgi:hypothetical protein
MPDAGCPMCDCCEVAWAAPLGSLWHACCRACGILYTFTPSTEDECYVVSQNTEGNPGDVR